MSLNVLYCEGNSKSLDIRLLQQLLPGTCLIKPIGGKNYGFEEKIISDRAINPKLAGLCDRDFDCRDFRIANEPIKWFYGDVQIGWFWERKEIENYAIDPEVVGLALGRKAPPIDEYKAALQKAAETISAYTAARTALSCYRFKNSWGEQVDKTHYFPQISKLGKDRCRDKIKEIVRQNKGDRIVEEQNVVDKFENLLPLYRPDGDRFQNLLTFFAGKDLLYVMKHKLQEFGFNSKDPINEFLERIFQRIELSEDVWTWMPEWQKLRESITNFDS
ncbi:MAG: hypothetical protein HC786_11810 [Richelia sp. CSU_2_1]|nr:hypothetical protein [Microcoleus sp. SU_5_6]NJL67199.1 hypothetical protein [Microcoleus sp. SM1_3_4]NJR22791.1 hypothetical protein [Richelia sp. CSU_2_1]